MKLFATLCVACTIASPSFAANVVVSIKPIHSLARMVMEGSGDEPFLLVDGTQSLHSFSLKPSQVSQLQKADAVFYISDDLETFLDKSLDNAPTTLKRIEIANHKSITLLPVRRSEGFEEHHHDEDVHKDHDEHEHESSTDFHLWSSPDNAKAIIKLIATELATITPAYQALYATNADKAIAKIYALDTALKARMLPLKNRPFVSFHDATQYFEKAYGLQSVGTLTLHPERSTSAKHIKDIQAKINAKKAVCVFHEPQFDAKISQQLAAGRGVKTQTIDPEAALLKPSANLYFELLESMAQSFEGCLN